MTKGERIKLPEYEARAIAYDDHDDYRVIDEEWGESGHWVQSIDTYVRRLSDDKLFHIAWARALTEAQEDEFLFCELVEVERKTITIEVPYYEEV